MLRWLGSAHTCPLRVSLLRRPDARGLGDVYKRQPQETGRVRGLGGWGGLEHVLNGMADRRHRTGLPEPRAARLREDGREGGAIQLRHAQVTHNHVIGLHLGRRRREGGAGARSATPQFRTIPICFA